MLKPKPPKKVRVAMRRVGTDIHLGLALDVRMKMDQGCRVEFKEDGPSFTPGIYVLVTPQFFADAIFTACGVQGHTTELFQAVHADELARIYQGRQW